jgi:hypothetical protein
MSSLFSLVPSAPVCDVQIVAGFKVEEVLSANLAQSASQRHQKIITGQQRASCARKASMVLRAACKRFTITTLIRFKSS